ncbi:Z1 domain-containing protein [uncultured Methanolobus sp.]|uniref:Z1 domain-containing protein n=1 Tax=uncultured Methanolobus sp. TaxID=218300 RepID=UPI0029C789B4|nr:Z1 domain-containing protein [uncultured Methanolobus sp.]
MYKQAIRTIRTFLPDTGSITIDEIEKFVDITLSIEMYKDLEKEKLVREIESLYRIRQDDYKIIEGNERRKPWLNEKKSQIGFENGFWGRYREYLEDEKNFAPDTINKLDDLTDKILDNLFDPTKNIQIDKKGLVVGQVQSGKTANYTGLICKAADAGFGLIIVLAGIHNNLRSQTQLRLDEGFLGFDTQYARAFNQNKYYIGVGCLRKPLNSHAQSLTSSLDTGDFTQGSVSGHGFNFDTNDPIIAVIKKNSHVLRRIYTWLASKTDDNTDLGKIIRDKPLLLIDDEADNASINISNDPEKRSTINDRITNIINLFGKNAYVGYTATPFANIFIPIDEDNLFPRDFIINIPAPSNHIGPDKIFGFDFVEDEQESETTLPIVNRISDYHTFVPDKHKIDDQLPSKLPQSLKLAIRCFIITCAIRRFRGQINSHNSMLIHVSRFVRWQNHITELVENQFNYYKRGINQNDSAIIEEFRKTFESDEDGYKSYVTVSEQIINSKLGSVDTQTQVHDWKDILLHLDDATSRIHVKSIHGGSKEALEYYNYEKGYNVIAIGGNKLSRGLTLEGLSVSYYLRASRMYDTLMQMGRWFGYRNGYVDLCRLFTSRELNEWFCHITRASEDLRKDFEYMSNIAGLTPRQYALKVRTHPGVLQISATNKMRSAINIEVSWSGRLVELYELKKDISTIENNIQITKKFISRLPENFTQLEKGYLWYDVQAEEVISFLESFQSIENLKAYNPQKLADFIAKQLPNNELTSWRVALMSKNGAANDEQMEITGTVCKIGQWVRTQHNENSDNEIYYIRKSHIISPKDESIDLTTQEYNRAMELTREQRRKNKKVKEPAYPSGEIIRNEIRDPKNPLLLIYLLDPDKSETYMPDKCPPFVGYAISFPRSNYNVVESYAINKELLDRFNIEDDFDDDEEDED